MWLERIIEAKKANKISTKMMSERTRGHLPERTINRILSGETEFPRIDTILELGQAVGLTAQELFAETNAIVTDYEFTKAQVTYEAQISALEHELEEVENLRIENNALYTTVIELKAEIKLLTEKLELRDEIINLHKKYMTYIESMKGREKD